MAETLENRIFVSNLPAEANQEIVATHFSQFGATTDVYLPLVATKDRHKGIAYVTFEQTDARELALQHPFHEIGGQQVNVQVCLPKGQGKGSSPLPGTMAAGENRIFVQGIGQEVLQEEVQAYFSQYGGWSDIFMPKGSYTAGHKGICFVSFNTPDSVTQVINSAPHIIGGQQVTVDIAIARNAKGAGKGALDFGKTGGKAKGVMFGQSPQNLYQPPQHFQQQPRGHLGYQLPQQNYQPPQHHNRPPQPPAARQLGMYGVAPPPRPVGPAAGNVLPGRLFLTKMSPDITHDDLQNYFSQFGELNDVYMPPGGKLIAFIGYSEPSAAVSVAAMHTHEVKPGCSVCSEPALERGGPGGGKGPGKGRFSPY